MRNVDFLRDEDLRQRADYDGPEDGDRRGDDGEIDLERREDEREREPPGEVEGEDNVWAGIVAGYGPEAQNGHEYDAGVGRLVC